MPGGTDPIILHRDAVSGGGYFMLGTVISANMDFINQLQPHQGVRFESVQMEVALSARQDETSSDVVDRLRVQLGWRLSSEKAVSATLRMIGRGGLGVKD